MYEVFESIWEMVNTKSQAYGVDPIIFGILYLGSIPPYILSLGWLVRSIKQKRPLTTPLTLVSIFFVLPMAYIVVFGRNIETWVYVCIAILAMFAAYSVYRKVLRLRRVEG